MTIIDHKTGKARSSHAQQLSLYGLAGMLWFPKVKEIHAQIYYLDIGPDKTLTIDYTRDDLEDLKTGWEGKVKGMFSDRSFQPRPGHHCRWCPLTIKECKFSSKKEMKNAN